MITRRGLFHGVGAFLAAPAIVRASSLMPVVMLREEPVPFRYLGLPQLKMEGSSLPFDPADYIETGRDGWGRLIHRRIQEGRPVEIWMTVPRD